MQFFIDPDRVEVDTGPFTLQNTEIITGDASRVFCERVSRLVEEEGLKIIQPPRLFFKNGGPAIYQMLRK